MKLQNNKIKESIDVVPLNIEAIIFDFDGVLAESVSVKGDAFVELYKDESLDIQKQVRSYHEEHGGVTRLDKIRYYEETLCNRPVSEQGVIDIADRFSDIVENGVIQSDWVSGAKDILELYHQKIPLYIASATPQDELRRIIDRRKMSHYFREINGTPKKKDEHLISIIADNSYNPKRTLMVGDAITDYNAAQAAGTAFIGRLLPDKISPFPEGTKLIKALTELPEMVKIIHE